MRKHALKILLLIFIVCGFATNVIAEPIDDFDRPHPREKAEQVRKRIETLKMWKLTKALDIDEKTSAQLFPLMNKYDKKRAEIEYNLRKGMRDLRESLKQNDTERIKSIISELEQNHNEMQSIDDEEWQELKKILTLEQQAKFILFRHEFDREIRKIIAEATERRHKREKNRRNM